MHLLKLEGQLFPSFCSSSGVRQWCPVSPLLFVICIDALLRRLAQRFPKTVVRAYADDDAMITHDFLKETSGILGVYEEFAKISNLRLNLPKTVLVPLWPHNKQQLIRTLINDTLPEWSSAVVSDWSRYLGFALGPGRASHSWDTALKKYVSRVGMWSTQKLGMFYTARVYNTFAFTTLSFLWQLEEVPDKFTRRSRRLPVN